jgi:hypothetical protein
MTESTESLPSSSTFGISDAEIRLLATPCPTEQTGLRRRLYTDNYYLPPVDPPVFELVKAVLPGLLASRAGETEAITAAVRASTEAVRQLREQVRQ